MTLTMDQVAGRGERDRADIWALVGIAGAVALLHVLTNGRYGFHRDELQVLSDARHMDWGFVPYPPLTPFVERVSMAVFGLSMVGLRMASVVAQAVAVVVTGLMAYELGGGRLAQVTAALAIALSGLPMFEGTEFQYTTFDYLWWALIAYFVIRLLKTENPRWWLAIGATIGIGFQTKYTMGFYLAGILGGVVLTNARRHLLSGWFWGGMALGFLICLPNLVWQVQHGFISLHFLQHIHKRDVRQGRADGFLLQQFWLCTNAVTAPLWIGGLLGYFWKRRYRMLGWMYVDPAAAVHGGQGARILPRRGVSDVMGDGCSFGRTMGCIAVEVATASGGRSVLHSGGGVWATVLAHPYSIWHGWTPEGVRPEEQWRSAGRDWVGRIGEIGCGHSRCSASGAAAECRRNCGKLRRGRSD